MSENKPEPVFADGIFFNKPHENAPDFIKGSVDFANVDKAVAFLKEHQSDNRLSLDLKVSKAGKLYFQLNTWKPEPKDEEPPF